MSEIVIPRRAARWLAVIGLGVLLMIIIVCAAPNAKSDADDDKALVESIQLDKRFANLDAGTIIREGHAVCSALASGQSEAAVYRMVAHDLGTRAPALALHLRP